MSHAWEQVDLTLYEEHMNLASVQQLQTLHAIMKDQLGRYPVHSGAIWGVAGGNGLDHAAQSPLAVVYGIDINREYLQACRERYSALGDRLVLLQRNLAEPDCELPHAELVIANLVIEYLGLDAFCRLISRLRPDYLSSVVQENEETEFVSLSPYQDAFEGISALHEEIKPDCLILELERIGYRCLYREEFPLPNGKRFIRCDFTVSKEKNEVYR
ncbi:class I SAM-dependent methyltransferase [Gorillibacterium sp. CAU 1737]|uniref:class I SAM-dependent methyltransferase n=1 Tax=Gorillibacterium sp. CAU 1737 TaxID=3140362 RepID=UPI003260CF61